MQERNAGLYVQHFIIWKGDELFGYLVDQDAVTVRVDLFRGGHLFDLLYVLLLEDSLLLALPLGLLVEGLAVHQRQLKFYYQNYNTPIPNQPSHRLSIPSPNGLYIFYRYFLSINNRQMQFSPHFADDEEEDFEEVPCEFDTVPPAMPHHDTPQFSSNLTQRRGDPLTPKRMSNDQFFKKSEEYLNNKRQKLGSLKAEIDHRAMADCTFKPAINRSHGKNPRNLKQFLDFQANHQAKINQKTNTLKQRIEDENQRIMTFSPQINKTKFIKSNKQNDTVHQRLYKLKDKERDLPIVFYDHTPKITEKGERVVRNMPGFELLYEDAKRRADKHNNQKVEPTETAREKNVSIEKFAAQKFLKDYKAILFALNLQQKESFEEQDFKNILQGLGYTIYTAQQNTPLAEDERQLVKQAFDFLSRSGVTQANLFVFLLAVGGIYNIQLADNDLTCIGEVEGKKIHSYFDCLFRNRLLSDYSKKLGRTPPRQQSPFKPTINPDSNNLAEKYRNKMISRANSIFAKNSIDIQIPDKGLAHEDLLVIYNLGQNLQKQKMREQKKHQKDPECTFQPNSDKHTNELYSQDVGAEKCHDLYEQAKARQAEINKIGTMQTFYEQQQQTNRRDVSPKASKSNKNALAIPHPKSNIKSYLDIKDVDKTLARMAIGRQIRNEKRQFQERGQKITHKNASSKRISECVSRQKEVLFDVDVSINGVNKKIFIYSDDRYRIPEVVTEFSQQCGLDAVSQRTLEQQLLEAVAGLPQSAQYLP